MKPLQKFTDNRCTERFHERNITFDKEQPIRNQSTTEVLFNDCILQNEWKQLSVGDDTDCVDEGGVHLRKTSVYFMETGSTIY